MRTMLKKITGLLFPEFCLGCGIKGELLCEFCFRLIKPLPFQHCYRCRKISLRGKICDDHPKTSSTLDRVFVACHYSANPLLEKAIFAFKYEKKSALEKRLITLLLPFISLLPENSVVIPVPLHKNRQRERGYNQSELLCRALKILNPKLSLDSDLLKKTKDSKAQVEVRDLLHRRLNVSDVFEIQKPCDPTITYVLVDDVMSTGATLENCCKALKTKKAKKVWGISLARN